MNYHVIVLQVYPKLKILINYSHMLFQIHKSFIHPRNTNEDIWTLYLNLRDFGFSTECPFHPNCEKS